MKLDILAFSAHPDDVELSCGGTIIKETAAGKKVGIIDLTEGELGSRGSRELRYKEAAKASEIMGLSIRENINIGDGFFEINQENLLKVIEKIRKYQPDIILTNAIRDRHPDHQRGYELVDRACFLSGLIKIETTLDGVKQEKWRPRLVLNYVQDYFIEADVVVDVTNQFDEKMKAIMAYSSQFYDPNSKEPQTPISGEDFLEHLKGRASQYGRAIQTRYAEGFTCVRSVGVNRLEDLI